MTAGATCLAGGALDNAIAEQAIEWMVLFRSGEATPDDNQRFCAWCSADPRHALAWERMQGILRRSFAPIREAEGRSPGQADAVKRVILHPPASGMSAERRKILRGTLVFAAASVTTGLLVNRSWPLGTLTADLSTGTGQRKQHALPDGSTLVLNARSAVDIDYSASRRRIHLRQGGVIATVVADGARPFIVETPDGSARALGTRFLVQREANQTLALVLQHSIRISNGKEDQVLNTGDAVYYDRRAIGPVSAGFSGRAAWAEGMLVANDENLADVIAALRPYRKGFIRLSPKAGHLRVLGAFSLDDTDNVLRSLEQTMPLRIRNYGDLLVTIDLLPVVERK